MVVINTNSIKSNSCSFFFFPLISPLLKHFHNITLPHEYIGGQGRRDNTRTSHGHWPVVFEVPCTYPVCLCIDLALTLASQATRHQTVDAETQKCFSQYTPHLCNRKVDI